MYAYEKIKSGIIESISKASGMATEEVVLERPPEGIKADYSFPCFVLAKKERKNPVEIANNIVKKMKPSGFVEKVEPAGPYINFHIKWKEVAPQVLNEISELGTEFGSGKQRNEKIVVEFAQPNTHKALHIGHIRNLSFGESVSRILGFAGFKVIRANYQGDIGPHIAKCLWGISNLGVKEPKTDKGKWLGDVYTKASQKIEGNEKFENEISEINKKLYARDKSIVDLWKKTRQWSLDYFESVYKDFGVKFDRYYFESEVENKAIKLSEDLERKGVAKMSDGAIIIDLKNENLGIFVLLTKEKTPLYSSKDMVLAEIKNKEYDPDKMIIITGSEQEMYFKQLVKGLEMFNPGIAKKEFHIWYGFVNLKSGKMSSRLGKVITYDQLKEEVLKKARDITRNKNRGLTGMAVEKVSNAIAMASIKYDMIRTSPEKTITFDWEQALSFEGNTAPYIQYTHARACSILKKSGLKKIGSVGDGELKDEKEINLIKELIAFPEAVQNAARNYRPHYIANYAYELATLFNEFYQSVPVLKSEEEGARLVLVAATRNVIKIALNLLGIEAPEEM